MSIDNKFVRAATKGPNEIKRLNLQTHELNGRANAKQYIKH